MRAAGGPAPGRRRRRLLVALVALFALSGCAAAAAGDGRVDAVGVPPIEDAGRYVLPVEPTRVLREFQPPPQPWSTGHRGVDLAAQPDTRVTAPQVGVVTFAGPVAGRGVVTVRHDDGLTSSLEPVAASVAVGTRVERGAPLGVVEGAGHCAPATCVHWGVRAAPQRYVDPLALVRPAGPVVLLAEGGAPGRETTWSSGPRAARRAQQRSASSMRVRSRVIAAVCICEIRDSVTPSTRPISASVMPS